MSRAAQVETTRQTWLVTIAENFQFNGGEQNLSFALGIKRLSGQLLFLAIAALADRSRFISKHGKERVLEQHDLNR